MTNTKTSTRIATHAAPHSDRFAIGVQVEKNGRFAVVIDAWQHLTSEWKYTRDSHHTSEEGARARANEIWKIAKDHGSLTGRLPLRAA